jgi:hypothetical protein
LPKINRTVTPLKASISDVSRVGIVKVKFSKPVVIPKVYLNVSNARLESNFTDNFCEMVSITVKSGADNFDKNRTEIAKYNLTDF